MEQSRFVFKAVMMGIVPICFFTELARSPIHVYSIFDETRKESPGKTKDVDIVSFKFLLRPFPAKPSAN